MANLYRRFNNSNKFKEEVNRLCLKLGIRMIYSRSYYLQT